MRYFRHAVRALSWVAIRVVLCERAAHVARAQLPTPPMVEQASSQSQNVACPEELARLLFTTDLMRSRRVKLVRLPSPALR